MQIREAHLVFREYYVEWLEVSNTRRSTRRCVFKACSRLPPLNKSQRSLSSALVSLLQHQASHVSTSTAISKGLQCFHSFLTVELWNYV